MSWACDHSLHAVHLSTRLMSSQLVAEFLSQGGFLALNKIEVQGGLLDKESTAM